MGCTKSKTDDGGTSRVRPSSVTSNRKERSAKKNAEKESNSTLKRDVITDQTTPISTPTAINAQQNILRNTTNATQNRTVDFHGPPSTRIGWPQEPSGSGLHPSTSGREHFNYDENNQERRNQTVNTFPSDRSKQTNKVNVAFTSDLYDLKNKGLSRKDGSGREIIDVNRCCLLLWDNDDRPRENQDYKISTQVGGQFVSYVDHNCVADRPTFTLLDDMFNTLDQNSKLSEESKIRFVKTILQTTVMKLCYEIIRECFNEFKNLNINEFYDKLQQIWFSGSNREAYFAFQHIFAGDKNGKGLHNWYRFYHLASKNKIVLTNCRRESFLASVKFKFIHKYNSTKESSMFIGTTPEFEIALYTLLYFIIDKVYKKNKQTYTFKPNNQKEVRIKIVTNYDSLITAYPRCQQSF